MFVLFADQIPLEAAARKWNAGRRHPSWETPDRMRFYALTQYLHWMQCSFEPHGRPKTMRTLVHIKARVCPACGGALVGVRTAKTCGCQVRRRQ